LEKELSDQNLQPQDILNRKKELIQSKALTVITTYDTFERESGKKDVSLCENSVGEKVILRIGEIRTNEFFLEDIKERIWLFQKYSIKN